jgi:ABC-type polysaccharide/polyol phosphate export permease
MAHVLVSYQQILFDGAFDHWSGLALAGLCAVVAHVFGAFFFERLRDTLAEEV